MERKVDITDKLTFDGNPVLVIKGKELEVNADAPTMLKVMGLVGDDAGPKEIIAMYDLMFPDKSRKELDKMKLCFEDLVTVINAAVSLITGEESDQGEPVTRTMTCLKTGI